MWIILSNTSNNDISFRDCFKKKIEYYLQLPNNYTVITTNYTTTFAPPLSYHDIENEIYYLTNENEFHTPHPSTWVPLNDSEEPIILPQNTRKDKVKRLQQLYSSLENMSMKDQVYDNSKSEHFSKVIKIKPVALVPFSYTNNTPIVMNVIYLLLFILLYIIMIKSEYSTIKIINTFIVLFVFVILVNVI